MLNRQGTRSLVPESERSRPATTPSGSEDVDGKATRRRILHPRPRRKPPTLWTPKVPPRDPHGEPLDFAAIRWGERLVQEIALWRHHRERRAEAEREAANG